MKKDRVDGNRSGKDGCAEAHAKKLEEHLAFCRESERISYQELDKLKLSLPILLLGVVTYLSANRAAGGSWLVIAVISTGLCLCLTAVSFHAAACANRREVIDAQEELGLTRQELSAFEKRLSDKVTGLNLASLVLAVVSVIAVSCLLLCESNAGKMKVIMRPDRVPPATRPGVEGVRPPPKPSPPPAPKPQPTPKPTKGIRPPPRPVPPGN